MVGAKEQVVYTEASHSTVRTGRLASSTGMVRTSPPAVFVSLIANLPESICRTRPLDNPIAALIMVGGCCLL